MPSDAREKQKDEKRRRKRKAGTARSPPAEVKRPENDVKSQNNPDRDPKEELPKRTKKSRHEGEPSSREQEEEPGQQAESSRAEALGLPSRPGPKRDDFSLWYLRQLTTELAEDLDKVRQAPDFSDGSLEIIVRALQQGESTFNEEEKRRIMSRHEVQS